MSNGAAVRFVQWPRLSVFFLVGLILLTGCSSGPTYEKVDLEGHVRIEGPEEGQGYCFRVPKDWEIREQLEGSDVVCLAPAKRGVFRVSVIARTLSSLELKDSKKVLVKHLADLGESVNILEQPSESGWPTLIEFSDSKFASKPLEQLLFLHQYEDGHGVLICCTASKQEMPELRKDFTAIVDKAHFDLKDCSGPTGVPEVFPTPEVTFSPAS